MSVEIVNYYLVINEKHAYKDTESRREDMCGIIIYTGKVSPAVELD